MYSTVHSRCNNERNKEIATVSWQTSTKQDSTPDYFPTQFQRSKFVASPLFAPTSLCPSGIRTAGPHHVSGTLISGTTNVCLDHEVRSRCYQSMVDCSRLPFKSLFWHWQVILSLLEASTFFLVSPTPRAPSRFYLWPGQTNSRYTHYSHDAFILWSQKMGKGKGARLARWHWHRQKGTITPRKW